MLDVVDRSSVDAAFASIVADHGRIDILVNCAGVYGMQFLADITEAEFDRVIGINLKGLLFVTQAVARHMIEGGAGGTIVNVASAAGRRPSQGSMVYSASKAGVISVTQGAALELASHGIRVNAIAPGGRRDRDVGGGQGRLRRRRHRRHFGRGCPIGGHTAWQVVPAR